LQDISWQASKILIQPAKKGKAVEQPLLPVVGNALVAYLKNGRPQTTSHQEVFLTTLSPWKPLAQTTMTEMVTRRLKRAGVQVPNASKGSHLFRHLFASKMLKSGVPLEHIAQMLGHRSEESTLIYTKIDFNNLMDIAQEWPEVRS
jgi:integrase/recombinase XerD